MLTTEPTGLRPTTDQAAAVAATGRSGGEQSALESPATRALAASLGDAGSVRVLRDDRSCC
ncbi:hypothetical protein [Actinacidiphila sp. bgisy167]|uniref:hypothetical protein n=1 Tax=Actinacidiphila sp. bgisy167 TaxID=3413797 RepID=UPI003D731D73